MTQTRITVAFSRTFLRGILEGITSTDRITHVDRWHAAQWIKGIRRNTRRGALEYRIFNVRSW